MRKQKLQSIVTVILALIVAFGIMYFSGCAPTAPKQQTISPERQKAIKDSIDKAYKFELMKQWSTGYEYYKPKIYKRAIKPFWKIVELDTIDMFKDVYSFLSDCYFKLGVVDTAEMVLSMGIEKYPDNVGLRRNRAYIYANKEMVDEAITEYEKVTELDSEKVDDWKRLANLYVKNDQIDDAIEAYRKIVELDPNDKQAQQDLARLISSTGDTQAVIEQMLTAQKLDPENPQLMYELANLYVREQDYKPAIKEFNKYLTKKPDDFIALEALGTAYYNDSQYRSAITTFKKIVAAKPDHKKVLCDIATSYRMLGELQTARTYARRAIKVDKKYGLSYIVIGEIYESAVDKCLSASGTSQPKFMDKLVYRAAYRQYQIASKDSYFADEADRKMGYLKDFLPTKEDEFFNKDKKDANGRYKITNKCYTWIASSL